MDYYQIGQRIRKYRKAMNISQDELAARVGISTTHMSHIETGNTKLSLPVLVELAKKLDVYTDDLIFGKEYTSKSSRLDHLYHELESCSSQQLEIIIEIVKATKTALDKHSQSGQ